MGERLFDGVMFDLDGTLVDSLADLADSANEVLSSSGHAVHPRDAYRRFVGDGITVLMERALPASARSSQQVAEAVASMRQVYARNWNASTRPYAGILELVGRLLAQNYCLAVLSNKPHAATVAVVNAHFAVGTFEQVQGAGPEFPHKPDPASALMLAARQGVPPSRWLYVGDTGTDMATAVAAGMFPCGVLWGFRDEDELLDAGAKAILRRPHCLMDLLMDWTFEA
jgi:phosphoglycolate phosphatase